MVQRVLTQIVVSVAIIGLFTACGGKKQVNLTPASSEKVVKGIPDWYMNPPQDPNFLYAAATATSRDLQLSVDKAKEQGRADIARQLEMKMQGLTKRFDEEVGLGSDSELLSQFTQTTKSVVSQTLNGTRARKQEVLAESGIYRAYALMEMPIGAANTALMEKIKANQNMYTRFRASEAFKDLDAEVQKYEQFKKEQGAGQ